MRLKGLSRWTDECGSSLWEMVLLFLALALFILGVVALTSRGINSLQPTSYNGKLVVQGERLLDRLEALIREAIIFYPSSGTELSSAGFIRDDSVGFAADLVGNARKGEVAAYVSGSRGILSSGSIKDVVIEQPSAKRNELVARLVDGDMKNKEVILARNLDARDPISFWVDYEVGDHRTSKESDPTVVSRDIRVAGVHLYLKLEDRGKTIELDRAFKLRIPAPVRTPKAE